MKLLVKFSNSHINRFKTRYFFYLTIAFVFFIVICISYAIRRSEAIGENLIKFQLITKSNPLLYDPSTDVSFLRTSIIDLKNMDNKIIGIDSKYRQALANQYGDIYPDDWRLWPDDFLSTLPAIHSSTEDYLKNPNLNNAIKLLKLYELSADKYKKAIDSHIKALEAIFTRTPNVRQRKILFLGAATTPEIVYNDFLLIRKNAEALEREVGQRRECIYKGNCVLNKNTSAPEGTNKKAVFMGFNPIPKDILGINRKNNTVFGPYWAATGCFGFTKDNSLYNYPFYLVNRTRNSTGNITLKPMMTNTKFYRDYTLIPNNPTAQVYLKKGITLRPHPETNDYLCTDLRYIPRLIIQYLKETKKVSQVSEKSEFIALPYLMQHTLSSSDVLYSYVVSTKKALDPLTLLTTHTAYSLYFGTFSQAIWRISEKPTFLISKDYVPYAMRAGFIKYEDLIKRGLTKEEITKLNSLPHVDEVYKEETIGY